MFVLILAVQNPNAVTAKNGKENRAKFLHSAHWLLHQCKERTEKQSSVSVKMPVGGTKRYRS